MEATENIERAKKLYEELLGLMKQFSDVEAIEFLDTIELEGFFESILDPRELDKYPSVAEFLLANKHRSHYIAAIHDAITHSYSFKVVRDSQEGFVSPVIPQWFDDGVMFVEGQKRFAGLLGLYRNGELSYAIASRDAQGGDTLGPKDVEFVDIGNARQILQRQFARQKPLSLDEPIQEFEELLNAKVNDEGKYQELLNEYPWVFGAHYAVIQRHLSLDDKNIPDFTGKRHEGERDIFEVKPPFTSIFRKDGSFTKAFYDALTQAENYLNFVRQNKSYLREEKGLIFVNPKCYLILGINLNSNQKKELSKKQANTPVEIKTYDDLMAFMKATVKFLRGLKGEDEIQEMGDSQ